jgi:hypothetical protein
MKGERVYYILEELLVLRRVIRPDLFKKYSIFVKPKS